MGDDWKSPKVLRRRTLSPPFISGRTYPAPAFQKPRQGAFLLPGIWKKAPGRLCAAGSSGRQNASSARLGARFTFLFCFGRAIGRNMAIGGRHAAHAACCQTLFGRSLRWGFVWAGRIWELIILCAGIRRLTSNALTAVLFLQDQGNNIFFRDGDAPQNLVLFFLFGIFFLFDLFVLLKNIRRGNSGFQVNGINRITFAYFSLSGGF